MRIGAAIASFAHEHNLGEVYAAETGFIAGHDPDSVRARDVAFVRKEIADAHDEEEWLPHAPDLAVEVLSPTERSKAVQEKIRMWLNHGGRSVWVIDGQQETAAVYRSDGTSETFTRDQSLRDDAVLPGFSLPLEAIFVRPMATRGRP